MNSVDAVGRVVDDTNDQPVTDIAVSYGTRSYVVGADGEYRLLNLPRGARVSAQKPGYQLSAADATAHELRMIPVALTLQVNQEGTTPPAGVPFPEARQPENVQLRKGTETGSLALAPYPDRNKPVLICAAGYESREIMARGVLMTVELKKDPDKGCPPLPSPSPTPTPRASPTASPSASPTPSPSP